MSKLHRQFHFSHDEHCNFSMHMQCRVHRSERWSLHGMSRQFKVSRGQSRALCVHLQRWLVWSARRSFLSNVRRWHIQRLQFERRDRCNCLYQLHSKFHFAHCKCLYRLLPMQRWLYRTQRRTVRCLCHWKIQNITWKCYGTWKHKLRHMSTVSHYLVQRQHSIVRLPMQRWIYRSKRCNLHRLSDQHIQGSLG